MPQKNILAVCQIIALLLFVMNTAALAQENVKLPAPSGNPNQLFYLQRSTNTNTVVYELNLKERCP